ncbi:LLM class F420-dependent oxidoreductase [Oceanicoccus sp. KOV_DT_Chl]|uniref:LLM class F420-dependent oxidoreductase n=1 Tax=Oceanicoccus sp. KOV_DT_Chl TaxID=1904639 RepID=UPI001F1F98D3|nr:LLM class F420-dependent oxidoreductase [Oceanicoccus sp. KOV_DT_Chl]
MIKLGVMLGYSGKQVQVPIDMIKQAEALGYDSLWTAEAYGSDAITVASWILAQTTKIKVGTCIMQMPARTPAMAAMTAMTLNQLSSHRFIVGLGASGPQVVEGWHGVPYGKPITRTREYIQIMRKIMEREGPVVFDGDMYQLPVKGAGTTGLGKPLKSILHPDPSIPIYTASVTPAGLACAAEVGDGVFPIWMSPERFSVLEPHLNKGFERAGNGKSLQGFDIAPGVAVVLGDDVEACRQPLKEHMALYIGGMGAKGKNFYTTYTTSMGYGEAAEKIQDLYLAGDKAAAAAAVPNELVDEVALIGPESRIRERAQAWIEAGKKGHVGTMMLHIRQPEVLPIMADIFK